MGGAVGTAKRDREREVLIEKATEKWSGRVGIVKIGATASEGGSRGEARLIGGASTLPFLRMEGEAGHPPALALEVWDMFPADWPPTLQDRWGADTLASPVAWACQAREAGAEIICLRLASTHPDNQDRPVEAAIGTVRSILAAVRTPLMLLGSGHVEKDRELLPAVCEATKGERCLIGPAVAENYRTIAAACALYGHSILAESPIDVNLAKQLNILIADAGLSSDRIVMHHVTSALGYGLEYTYSIMERARLACLRGDPMLSQPMASIPGPEVWRARETTTPEAEAPGWGDQTRRGPLWEAVTALAYLHAGADLLVVTHPDTLAQVRAALAS